jgi:Planctomycete cytochrome C/WD domain, G-beta repeat
MRLLGFLLIGSLFTANASALHAADAKKGAKVTYDDHVLPILREKCFGCHNQDKAKGGLVMSSYTALMTGGSSGEVIKPGSPDDSRLFLLVSHKAQPNMPPKSPRIADENLETIKQWIVGGALENSGSKARAASKPKTEISLTSIVRGKPQGPPPMPPTTLSLEPVVRTARPGALTALAHSPWAPLVAVAGQEQVLLYHSETLELLGVLPFPEGIPDVLRFSRNGGLLLAGGGRGAKTGKVVLWNVKTGERILTVGDESDTVLAADISPDQTQIALGGPSKVIRIYGTKDGQLVREIKKHTDWVTALEYSPDGVLLATGDRNGGLFVWEAFTGREYFSLRGHTAEITDVSWRDDSNVLASASEDTTIRLWEMENGNPIKSWGAHGEGAQAVKYTHDNRLVSCGRDRVARIWDQNGALQKIFEAFPDVALRAAASEDDKRVIAGDWSGQIRVWNAADGKRIGNLVANPLGVAERLDAATKELAARQTAHDQLVATAAASQAAAQKAAADLAAAQKAVAEGPGVLKSANDAVARAKAAADNAAVSLKSAQNQAAAKSLLAKALGEAAVKVKDAADHAKDNPELAAAYARSRKIADQATEETATAQKAVAEMMSVAKATGDALAQAHQALTAAQSNAATAPKVIGERAKSAKALADKAALDKAAADQAATAVTALQSQLARLKAAASTRSAKK